MRAELIPVILGVLVGLVGLALLADARLPEGAGVLRERRRRARAERSRAGEAMVGVGTLCLAAALIGRDAWRYGTVAVLLGALLLVAGAVMNWRYLRETISFRGPARRTSEGEAVPSVPPASPASPASPPTPGAPPPRPPAGRVRSR